MGFFPDNKTSSYTTKLPKEIIVYDDYEVGLSSIYFPLTYYNVKRNEFRVFKNIEDPLPYQDSIVEIGKIQEGRYPPDSMIQEMFKKIDKSLINITVSDINRRATIEIGDKHDIILNTDLVEFLGGNFEPKPEGRLIFKKSTIYHGLNVIHYQRACHNLYIYCDLVEPRTVGDSQVSLLSVIPNPTGGSFGDTVVHRFENIRYFPLGKRRFDTIKIDVLSDYGQKIPFEDGKILIELHLRKVKRR